MRYLNWLGLSLCLLGLLAGCGGGNGRLGDPAADLTEMLDAYAYSKAVHRDPNYTIPPTYPHHSYFNGMVTIGADVAPREWLPVVGSTEKFDYFMGASRDGVGVHRLENYIYDLSTEDETNLLSRDGFYPFRVAPAVFLGTDFWNALERDDPTAEEAWTIITQAIAILNDALPPEFQIDPYSGRGRSSDDEGAIVIQHLPNTSPAWDCSATALACASSDTVRFTGQSVGYTRRADVYLPDGGITFDQFQTSLTLVLHELLHAIGIQGHVDSIEFPDSLMGKYGEFFPKPGHILHRIDREAIQAIYMTQRPESYNTLGEWTDTTLHLVGRSKDEIVNFGVALFNGLPQPWVSGPQPDTLMADAPSYLQGVVSWTGGLVGFSGVAPVGGDAALHVDLDNLTETHDLEFRDLYFLNRWEDTSDARWFSTRNLDYDVSLTGNIFFATSDEGDVMGAFVGGQHEGMAGTLHRTDLIGAYGGTRTVVPEGPSDMVEQVQF